MAEDIQVEEVQEEKKKLKGGRGRTRNFATIVYEESAPENWRDILDDCHVPAFISPLHDRDLKSDGTSKKSHWHVMVMYDGVKTTEQATDLFKSFGGVGCEIINNIRSYARYLCHLDSPNKVKYPIDNVVCLSGADYFDIITLPSDRYDVVGEIMDFCIEHKIYIFAQLLIYARHNRSDWYRALCDSCTYVIDKFLKSLRWADRHCSIDVATVIDNETGEVLFTPESKTTDQSCHSAEKIIDDSASIEEALARIDEEGIKL